MLLLFYVASYVLIICSEMYFHPFVVVVCFVVYALAGYKCSRREALAAGRLEGDGGSLSFVMILLVNNYAIDYVL